jgi:hypothetical protein
VSAWVDHPTVKFVRERHPDATPLEILFEYQKLLTELEDRFPGIPFTEIFRQDREPESAARVAIRLRDLGVDPELVDVALGFTPRESEPPDGKGVQKLAGWPQIQSLAELELTRREYVEMGIPESIAIDASRCRTPLTEEDIEIATRVLDNDESIRGVSRDTGRTNNTVRRCVYRYLWHNTMVAAAAVSTIVGAGCAA